MESTLLFQVYDSQNLLLQTFLILGRISAEVFRSSLTYSTLFVEPFYTLVLAGVVGGLAYICARRNIVCTVASRRWRRLAGRVRATTTATAAAITSPATTTIT